MSKKIAEYILKEQTLTNKRKYFVKWKNLSYKDCSWVNSNDIQNFSLLYQKFRSGNLSIDEDEEDEIDMIPDDDNSIEIINNENIIRQNQQTIEDRLFKYTSKSSEKQESSIEIQITKQKPSSSTNKNLNKIFQKKQKNTELNEDSIDNNQEQQSFQNKSIPTLNLLSKQQMKVNKQQPELPEDICVYNNSYIYYKQKINKDLYNFKGIKRHYVKDKNFYFSLLWDNNLIQRHYNSYVFSYRYLKEKNPKKLLEYLEPYLNKQIN